jgi:glycosyltransferase involved in cell wall biosynthesis
MPAVFARAAVFVSTSSLEGFPNVFLQASASGVPFASLEVGGEFLAEAGAGFHAAGKLRQLAEYIGTVWNDPQSASHSRLAREYIEQHHSLDAQSTRLLEVLEETRKRS